MRVLSSPKSEVVNRLRASRAESSKAQADYLDSLPQESLGEALYDKQLEREGLLRRQHLCLATGSLIFTAMAVEFTLNPGTAGLAKTGLRLASMVAGAGLIITGGVTGDKISYNRAEQNTLSDVARKMAPAMVDPKTQVKLVERLQNDDGEFVKKDLVGMLEHAKSHLEGQPTSPGIEGALHQVERDIKLLNKAPGETLSEVRELTEQRLKTRGKVRTALTYGFIASPLAAIGLAPLGLSAVGIGAMGGLATAAVIVDELHNDNALTDTLDRWELQLDSAREMAEELGPVVDDHSVDFGEDYLDINGIQVPISD